MIRNQLLILVAAGAAMTFAWGAVVLRDVGGPGDEVTHAGRPVSRSAVLPVASAPAPPQATVPPDLRVPTVEPGGGGAPRGGVVDDVANSPNAVGTAFVRSMWTHDTAIDRSSHDAAVRAVRWATDGLGSALTRPATRTTPLWDDWAHHAAFTRVRVARRPTPGQDVDSSEQLQTYRVDVRVLGDADYRDRLTPFLVTAAIVREDRRWLVERISLL